MKNLIKLIVKERPEADHSLEQYLMDENSLQKQCKEIGKYIRGKRVVFLGDDDHLSLVLTKFFNIKTKVYEIDERIISSLESFAKDLGFSQNYSIEKRNLIEQLPLTYRNSFDYFIANPPYSSKNEGYGILLWLSRGFFLTGKNAKGILTVPIMDTLPWSLNNLLRIQEFIISNNAIITNIKKDFHTYLDLPDKELLSSNIYINILKEPTKLITHGRTNPYR